VSERLPQHTRPRVVSGRKRTEFMFDKAMRGAPVA
jgi:hypothetical protein